MDIGYSLFLFKCNLAFQFFNVFFEWYHQESPANLGQMFDSVTLIMYQMFVLQSASDSLARLCALEALMQFGAPARKHSTNIMSVMEDDVYLVRLLLGESTRFWSEAAT